MVGIMAEPQPISLTQQEQESYSGLKPRPFVVIGGIPGGLVEDPNDEGTYIIESGA